MTKKEKKLIEPETIANQELSKDDINKDIFLPTSMQEYDVFDTPEGYKGYFPPSAIAAHGCLNCAWRGTHQCPYKFESGKVKQRDHPIWSGLKFPENVKVEGICSYKKNYLVLLSGEWEKRPTYDVWQSRLMKNKGVIQNSRDEMRYLKTAKELELLETELELTHQTPVNQRTEEEAGEYKELRRELAEKKKDYSTVRGEMMQSWHMLEGFFEKGVDRETAKKIDMSVSKKNIPHDQMLDIMRGDYSKVVEGEVVKDEEKD